MYTFVFGDIHGKPESLRRLLLAAGVINDEGNRVAAVHPEGVLSECYVISIGDLANAVREDVNGDEECLMLGEKWCDLLIMGNHESGYLFDNMGFNGFTKMPHLASLYRSLFLRGKVHPAALVGNTLITHAGVVEEFQFLTARDTYRAIMGRCGLPFMVQPMAGLRIFGARTSSSRMG